MTRTIGNKEPGGTACHMSHIRHAVERHKIVSATTIRANVAAWVVNEELPICVTPRHHAAVRPTQLWERTTIVPLAIAMCVSRTWFSVASDTRLPDVLSCLSVPSIMPYALPPAWGTSAVRQEGPGTGTGTHTHTDTATATHTEPHRHSHTQTQPHTDTATHTHSHTHTHTHTHTPRTHQEKRGVLRTREGCNIRAVHTSNGGRDGGVSAGVARLARAQRPDAGAPHEQRGGSDRGSDGVAGTQRCGAGECTSASCLHRPWRAVVWAGAIPTEEPGSRAQALSAQHVVRAAAKGVDGTVGAWWRTQTNLV